MHYPSLNGWAQCKLYRQEAELHQLIDFGSCGLHIIHGAFKTGIESTDWVMKNTLKGKHVDNVYHQYSDLYNEIRLMNTDDIDRLDDFYFQKFKHWEEIS